VTSGSFFIIFPLQHQADVETPFLAREFLVEPADDNGYEPVDDCYNDSTFLKPRSYQVFWKHILGKVKIQKRPPLKHCPSCQKLPSLKQDCRILSGLMEDYKLSPEEFADDQHFFFGKYADSLVKAQAKLQSLGLFSSLNNVGTHYIIYIFEFPFRVEARKG
jgi:hypothetical protein